MSGVSESLEVFGLAAMLIGLLLMGVQMGRIELSPRLEVAGNWLVWGGFLASAFGLGENPSGWALALSFLALPYAIRAIRRTKNKLKSPGEQSE